MALLLTLSFASCESSEQTETPGNEPTVEQGGLTLSVDRIRIMSNGIDAATFTLYADGKDVTAESTFYQSGEGSAMADNTFKTSITGKYEFYAAYGSEISDKMTIFAGPAVDDLPADPSAGSVDFESRVMMIQFTGTGCTWCQYMIGAIDNILEDETLGNMVEHVAVHTYNVDDPLYSAMANQFKQSMGIVAYPTTIFNLDSSVCAQNCGSTEAYYDMLYTMIDDVHPASPVVGITATTSVSGSILSANVGVKAAIAGEYRVGMLLLESGIAASQVGLGSMLHNNGYRDSAMRSSSYDFSGTPVGELEEGEVGSAILDINLMSSWKLENCHLLIYVTTPVGMGKSKDGEIVYDYLVQNVVRCEVEGSVAYQYN